MTEFAELSVNITIKLTELFDVTVKGLLDDTVKFRVLKTAIIKFQLIAITIEPLADTAMELAETIDNIKVVILLD